MTKWFDTEEGKAMIQQAFEATGLPEVEEKDLELGTFTNRQIAEKFEAPAELILILMGLPEGSPASMRSILSFAVDRQ